MRVTMWLAMCGLTLLAASVWAVRKIRREYLRVSPHYDYPIRAGWDGMTITLAAYAVVVLGSFWWMWLEALL